MHDPASDPTDTGFATLGEPACWSLLPDTGVGRLAWAEDDGRIVVVPVNYGRDGRSIVLRTGDTDLRTAARGRRRCAFQVEDLEPGLRSGWTVLIDATLTEVEDEEIAERLARLVDPWLREPRPYVLILQVHGVAGRSLHGAGGVQVVVLGDDGS
jgi:nitroimidazol reductase NimA-like FMN-containing flavoprotein (pyridoxamine 5'-phosphate oxidase superfamily)